MMLKRCLFGLFLASFQILIPYSVDAASCTDNNGNCKYWKDQGFCSPSGVYYAYMKNTCRKTCGICKVNPCESLPCKNGGTCTSKGSTFTCRCKHGYEGTRCEIVDPCAKKPCKNGGSCSRNGQQFSCKCPKGFEGNRCEKATRKPCQNSLHYNDRCSMWKNAGFCNAGNKYFGFMSDHCSKECGLCVPCVDKNGAGYCDLYKRYCKDKTYGPIVTRNCQKSCDACGDIVCGQGPDKLGRVVGGENVEPHAWRWQALLKIDGSFKCGGTLIAKQWVLTAGHCLRGKTASQLKITLGQHDRAKVEGTEQKFDVKEIVRNPQYNPSTKDSDIALLKLSSEAVLNKYVTLACLPTEPPTADQPCFITGWGRTVGLGETSSILQEAKLPVVSNEQCGKINRKRPITANMLCAGTALSSRKPQSGCQGDSGGPLVCQKGTTWSVQGVVSWGSSMCISYESYTVFARVTQFVDWIKTTIA